MNRRGMGKLSVIILLMLMLNTIGYMVIKTEVDMQNPYVAQSTPLTRFYTDRGDGVYTLSEDGTLYGSIPTQASDDILSGFLDFVDRILTIFPFIRAIVEFMLVPGTIFAIMGLPWQLAMILEVAFSILVVLGLIDLLAGADT